MKANELSSALIEKVWIFPANIICKIIKSYPLRFTLIFISQILWLPVMALTIPIFIFLMSWEIYESGKDL